MTTLTWTTQAPYGRRYGLTLRLRMPARLDVDATSLSKVDAGTCGASLMTALRPSSGCICLDDFRIQSRKSSGTAIEIEACLESIPARMKKCHLVPMHVYISPCGSRHSGSTLASLPALASATWCKKSRFPQSLTYAEAGGSPSTSVQTLVADLVDQVQLRSLKYACSIFRWSFCTRSESYLFML